MDEATSAQIIADLARFDERANHLERDMEIAHKRIDKVSVDLRVEIKGLRDEIKGFRKDLEPLRDWMNRGKGGIAVLVLAGSIIGGAIASVAAWWARN